MKSWPGKMACPLMRFSGRGFKTFSGQLAIATSKNLLVVASVKKCTIKNKTFKVNNILKLSKFLKQILDRLFSIKKVQKYIQPIKD